MATQAVSPDAASPTTDASPDVQTAELEFVMTIHFRTSSTVSAGHEHGDRVFVNVVSGSFAGPGIQGTVVAGSDWAALRGDNALNLDVRTQLLTDDGVVIAMTYQGSATRAEPGGAMRVACSPVFSAPLDSPYAWLTRSACVARADVGQGEVTYQVFALRM